MSYYFKRKPKKKKSSDLPLFDRAGIKVKKKPDLKAKLDKEFSLYIRLRDSMPGGAFRCISCGQIKPFDQADCGHYFSRTHLATRFDEKNCHAECRYCLTPEHKVLMQDLTWKILGEITIGDKLFAFDEERTHGNFRRYKVATATSVQRDIQDVYEVELENGDKIKTTANHKWLAREGALTAYKWIETKDLWINGKNLDGKRKSGPHTGNVTSVVCKLFQVIEQEFSYDSGWIAGMLDADGHICQQNINEKDGIHRYGFRIGIAQCEKYMNICNRIKGLLEKFTGNHKTCRQTMDKKTGFGGTCTTWQFLITGTNVEKLQFLMRTRPNKIAKVDIEKLGKIKSQYDTKVKSITYLGKHEIVVLETDTHTFIANGYAMHNCNRFRADHLEGYRTNLVAKIGQREFDLLKLRAGTTSHMSDFEYEELIRYYKARNKILRKEKGL